MTITKEAITPDNFTRIKNDVNGNPRYVIHFLALDVYGYQSSLQLTERYELAIKLAKTKTCGRKYHNKSYGGGIVFQSYSLPDLSKTLNKLIGIDS